MALDFPTPAAVGETWAAANGVTYGWDGVKWAAQTGLAPYPPLVIADAPPTARTPADFWWDSTGTQLYVHYTDPTSSQWVVANSGGGGSSLAEPVGASTWGRLETGTWSRSVNLAGDLMTGSLNIQAPWAQLGLSRPSGEAATLMGLTDMSSRWAFQIGDNVPEGGGNSGSNLTAYRYDDAGTMIDSPFSITRASGVTNFSVPPTVGGLVAPWVLRAGDTMTGNLTIAASYPTLVLNRTDSAASSASILGQSAGVTRWTVAFGEAGTDNFNLHRFDAAGAYVGTPLAITMSAGDATFSGNIDLLRGVRASSFTAGLAAPISSLFGASGVCFYCDPANSNLTFARADGVGYPLPGPLGWFTTGGRFHSEIEAAGVGISYFNYGINQFQQIWDGAGILFGIDNAVWHWYGNLSDERLKSDIAPTAFDGLAAVLATPLFQFRWKDHTIPGQPVDDPAAPLQPIGFVAQRSVEAFASAVVAPKATEATGDAMMIETLNPLTLIAAAYDAIKQLDARLTAGGL